MRNELLACVRAVFDDVYGDPDVDEDLIYEAVRDRMKADPEWAYLTADQQSDILRRFAGREGDE